MKKSFVYDLPTRVFHWLFASLFVIAFAIGKTVDDDSAFFSYHMLAGIVLSLIVVLRAIWGVIGTQHARFSGFSLHPRELWSYFKGLFTGDKRKWAGHNPASSWAAITMMLFALGLGITGYLMTNGQGGENMEEVHELLANGFILLVLLHLAGVVLHSLRHRDGIWKSMFSGSKSDVPNDTLYVRQHRSVGILFLLLTFGVAGHLVQNFDSRSRTLSVFGYNLNLGEAEEGEEHDNDNSRGYTATETSEHSYDDDD